MLIKLIFHLSCPSFISFRHFRMLYDFIEIIDSIKLKFGVDIIINQYYSKDLDFHIVNINLQLPIPKHPYYYTIY